MYTILLLLGLLLFLIIDTAPHIERLTHVTPEHIERLKHTFDQHRQRLKNNSSRTGTITFHAEDINIAANYLAKHFVNGHAHIKTAHQNATIQVSIPLSIQTLTGYINLKTTFVESDTFPQLHSIRLGRIPIPDFFSQFLIDHSTRWLQNHPKYSKSIKTIQHVKMTADTLSVNYKWQGIPNTSGGYFSVLSESEQTKVRHYYNLLIHQNGHTTAQTLSQVLRPLMQAAAENSIHDLAQKENRAAILAATFYILRLPLKYLMPEDTHWPNTRHSTVTLDGREDFAQHFIVSAAITAYADTILSDAIGLYKEIEDTRSGSGFSFNDIAADRAGTRFGECATVSDTKAVQLQQWVTQGLDDKDLMPEWKDLPEHLSPAAFKQQYGNLDTPAYEAMMNTIEERVEALPFLK